MPRKEKYADPRGHSLRIYDDIFDSPAYAALSPHDKVAYTALLRDLRATNNGDLSLTLTRAKKYGLGHHVTLARSLRALCAVGLVAITRKGGCRKGGERLPTLYRVTDRECYEIPAKGLDYCKATNEWKAITSISQGKALIQAAEDKAKSSYAKKNNVGHPMTDTLSRDVPVIEKTTSPRVLSTHLPCHDVSLVEKGRNPIAVRHSADFSGLSEIAGHRTPRVPPLYIATPMAKDCQFEGMGRYQRMTRPAGKFFSNLIAAGPQEATHMPPANPTPRKNVHGSDAGQRCIEA